MKIAYQVHSVSVTAFDVEVEFQGRKITTPINGMIVELVSDDGTMSHVLRAMPGADAEFAAANFTVGARVVATFELEPAKAEDTPATA